jgi:oxalate---CoA ligase
MGMTSSGASSIRDLLVSRPGSSPSVSDLGGAALAGTELASKVDAAADTLRMAGVAPGGPVAVVLDNGPAAALAFLSAATAGVAAPLNPAYSRAELEFLVDDLGAVAVVVAEGDAGAAVDVARERGLVIVRVPVDGRPGSFALAVDGEARAGRRSRAVSSAPDDVALLLHTSGTTARPKLVPLTHANLLASASNIARSLELDQDDHCLNVMPLFHVHGLVACLLASLAAGARVTCTPGFDAPRMLGWIQQSAPTWYSAVPTMHQAVLARTEPGASVDTGGRLRFVRSSSASLPPSVLEGLEAAFGVPVIEAYGMTEAAHQICSNPLPPHRRAAGSVGPAAGPDVRVIDGAGVPVATGEVGEVVIRGDNVTRGYLGDDGVNQAAFVDGWFRTGDEGYLDADGYLTLVGRIKEVINRGGEKISPREVDEALLDHPAVGQAVTFAVPDDRLGETVAAAVVPVSGTNVDVADLRAHVARMLAPFKVPVGVLVLDRLPTGATGKIQRVGLAERLGIRSIADLPGREPAADGLPNPELVGPLRRLWTELLDVDDVGVDDHFLDLGGDSMLATQMLARVRDELAPDVDAFAFFDAGTIRAQAHVLADARRAGRASAGPP